MGMLLERTVAQRKPRQSLTICVREVHCGEAGEGFRFRGDYEQRNPDAIRDGEG
jgi:hypothetical protein